MFDPMFVPPRHSAALHGFATACLPRLGRFFGNVRDVRVPDAHLARLRDAASGRAILAPNHPTETDPIVMFWVARLLGTRFHYLATRETLDGPRGWLLNRLGVYSVIRGHPDRESVRVTRRLLAEEDRRVVIFPEGLVYRHNDRLMPFQTGVAQMGFWALEDLRKAGRPPALPLVPVAIRYRCCAAPAPYIARALGALENALGLRPGPRGDYARLRRIGGAVLASMERREGLPAREDEALDARIESLRARTTARVAKAAGLELEEGEERGEQLHRLYNALKAWTGVRPKNADPYEERLYRRRAAVAAPLFAELLRLHNFIAFTGDYVRSEPTAERFLEVLGRIQQEVFGRVRHDCPLEAHVRAAPAIRLEEHYESYRERRRETVAAVTAALEEAVRALLRDLASLATPISIEETP